MDNSPKDGGGDAIPMFIYVVSLLGIIILCLLNIKKSGIAFIRLPHQWNTKSINLILYCCTISDCALIKFPWSGWYLKLKNININSFDDQYKYLIECLDEDKNIFSESMFIPNTNKIIDELINIIKEAQHKSNESNSLRVEDTSSAGANSTSLRNNLCKSETNRFDQWIDVKKVIPLTNDQSVFSYRY